ncbi:MAG: molybdopterin-guanine dinucleotide biosynthesis protein B [Pseudomonadota bacterium]
MKLFGIVGWKNAGKTGLMERLVHEIVGRGYRVSTLKHAHHAFDVDHPGKDSYRHRAAGAAEVLVVSDQRWALMAELRSQPEPSLDALLEKMDDVDLILIEGFKTAPHPKIEVWRRENGHPLIATNDTRIRAIASDGPLEAADLPVMDLNDAVEIADFILAETGL